MKTFDIIDYESWSEIGADADDPPEKTKGQYGISVESSGTSIWLFRLGDEVGNDLFNNGPYILDNILQQVSPGRQLHEVSWFYSSGVSHSVIEFGSVSGMTSSMLIHNPGVAHGHYDTTDLDNTYRLAMSAGRDRLLAKQEDELRSTLPPEGRIIVPLPLHPQKFLGMADRAWAGHAIILADTRKLIDGWKRQEQAVLLRDRGILSKVTGGRFGQPPSNNASCEDLALIDTTIEESLKYVRPERGYPDDPPYMNFGFPDPDRLTFNNGRHRTANLARLGAPFMPVMLDNRQADAFKAKYEVAGVTSQSIRSPAPVLRP